MSFCFHIHCMFPVAVTVPLSLFHCRCHCRLFPAPNASQGYRCPSVLRCEQRPFLSKGLFGRHRHFRCDIPILTHRSSRLVLPALRALNLCTSVASARSRAGPTIGSSFVTPRVVAREPRATALAASRKQQCLGAGGSRAHCHITLLAFAAAAAAPRATLSPVAFAPEPGQRARRAVSRVAIRGAACRRVSLPGAASCRIGCQP